MPGLLVRRGFGLARFLLVSLLGSVSVHAQSGRVLIDSLYVRADSLAEAGSTDAALRLYGQIVQRDSTEKDALYARANLYTERERYADAARALKQIQKIDPTPSDWVLGNRGWYLILAGKPQKAREPTRQAMERDPHEAAWPLNLGHSYALRGQPETAKLYYRKALRRLDSEEEYQRFLADFDRFVEEDRSREDVLAMKDWFQVIYLSEGAGGRPWPLALLGTWITLIVVFARNGGFASK